MSNYVISTLSNDVLYNVYDNKRKDINVVVKQILVKGGSNVINKKGFQVSSTGITTEVSDEDLKLLEENAVFKMHRERGFVKVIKGAQSSAQNAAEKMDEKDKSAQLTSEDFIKKNLPKPKLSIEEVEEGK